MHVHTVDTSDTDTTTSGPRTLRRGLQILRTLQANPESGLNVSSLARITDLQRPTVYRLLAALVESGFLKNVSCPQRFIARQQPSLNAPTQHPPQTHNIKT